MEREIYDPSYEVQILHLPILEFKNEPHTNVYRFSFLVSSKRSYTIVPQTFPTTQFY